MPRRKGDPVSIVRAYAECVKGGKSRALSGYDLMKFVSECLRLKAEVKQQLKEAAEAAEGGG